MIVERQGYIKAWTSANTQRGELGFSERVGGQIHASRFGVRIGRPPFGLYILRFNIWKDSEIVYRKLIIEFRIQSHTREVEHTYRKKGGSQPSHISHQ